MKNQEAFNQKDDDTGRKKGMNQEALIFDLSDFVEQIEDRYCTIASLIAIIL